MKNHRLYFLVLMLLFFSSVFASAAVFNCVEAVENSPGHFLRFDFLSYKPHLSLTPMEGATAFDAVEGTRDVWMNREILCGEKIEFLKSCQFHEDDNWYGYSYEINCGSKVKARFFGSAQDGISFRCEVENQEPREIVMKKCRRLKDPVN